MKKSLSIGMMLFIFLTAALCRACFAENPDFDGAFNSAAKMRGKEAAFGTDELVRSTTQILHQENMKILSEIDKLHKEIADLKKKIEDVKDIVEGGQ